jgi:ketosteroid isomerase-like protein
MTETSRNKNALRLKEVMTTIDRTGDYQPLIAILSEGVNFRATIPEGTPISGVFQGRNAVEKYFREIIVNVADFNQQVPMEFVDHHNKVIVLGDDSYVLKKTGQMFRSPYAMVVTFDGDFISDILIIQDLSGILQAYRD